MKPETRFKILVMADLREIPNLWFFKSQEVSVRGIPDILGCKNGRFIALELKRDEKAKIDKLQEYRLNMIAQAGGWARIMYPDNKDTVLEQLRVL